jgi:endo-1,4-beta-xylanase
MTRWSRRDVLTMTGAAALATRISAEDAEDSLDSIARAKGLRFGSALGGRGLADARYLDLVRAQCGLIVPENELKMQVVQPAPGEFHFERAAALFAFADSANLQMRGHTLLWHHPRWLPRWLETYDFGTEPATAAAGLLTNHIRKTTTQFDNRIISWDVVNEAVDNVTGQMRETRLSKCIGTPDEVLGLAFHAARDVLPDTELVYNDYMGWERDGANHRSGVLKLLERLRRDGVPVNALGLQSHIGADNQPANAARPFDARDERAWRRFLTEVTGMGYRLIITELDVNDTSLPGAVAARDAQVAALARAYLDITLDFRELRVVMAWGLADPLSWLQARIPRADGAPKRCNPFDVKYQPKPLRDAIAAAFRAAPMHRPLAMAGEPA